MQKHKGPLPQQVAAATQGQQAAVAQQGTPVQPTQAGQASPQLATVAAARPGAVLAANTLQVTRLVRLEHNPPVIGLHLLVS